MRLIRDQRGTLLEIPIAIAFVGIVAAISIPNYIKARGEKSAHECALAIDAGKETCPLTGAPYIVDAVDGKCCLNPQRHALEKLCRAEGADPIAPAHPPPSTVRLVAWGAVAWSSGGLFALIGVVMFVTNAIAFVRNPREWWASVNRRHF